jgi:anti-sigma regulatory factor (Ser/Thr protein kinase)
MTGFSASVLAQPALIADLNERVLAFLQEQQVDARAANHVGLIVEEVLTNIGTHGRCPDKPVRIVLTVEPDQVRGEVVDSGIPFDPRAAPEPNLAQSAGERPVGGLGLFLVRRFSSALEYASRNGENYLHFAVARQPWAGGE